MTNFNVKILGTANLSQMTSAFAKFEGQVAVLNKQLDALVSKTAMVDAAGFDNMNRAAMQASKNFRSAAASTGMFNTQQIKLNSQTDEYIKKLQAQKLTFRDLIKDRNIASAAYREQLAMESSIITRQPGGVVNGKRAYDFTVPTTVHKDLDTVGKRIGWISEQTKSAAHQMVNWGKNTQWAGRQLMVGFTMPVAAFGAAAGVMAFQIDKELTRITKVYDMASNSIVDDTERMGRVEAETANIRAASMATATNAAKQYGIAAKDTLAIQAELAATGKTGTELQQSTTEVMRISTLGEMEHQTALDATIALQSVFKMSTDELTESFNYMNSVENATSLQLKDFAAAIPIAAAPIKTFGGDIKELGVLLTAMRENGIGAVQGANAIKASMQRLSRPSKQIQEEFTALTGGNIVELVDQSGSLTEIFTKLFHITDDLANKDQRKVFAGLFGSYQVSRMMAMTQGMGDLEKGIGQVSDASRVAEEAASKHADTAAREMKAIQDSISGQFMIALETLKVELASMGEPFVQIATKVMQGVTGIISAFNGMPNVVKIIAGTTIAIAALAGPIVMLVGLFANLKGQFLGGIASITGFFSKFRSTTVDQHVGAAAADDASAAFMAEGTAVEKLTYELKLLAAAQREATLAQRQSALSMNPGSAPAGTSMLSIVSPDKSPGTVDGRDQTGGKHSAGSHSAGSHRAGKHRGLSMLDEKRATGGTGAMFAGSMVLSATAMAAMAASSNETVDNLAEMVMYAAMLGPMVTLLPWAAMGNKIKLMSGGLQGGVLPALGRMGTSLGASLMTWAKIAGPAGLIVGAVAGLAILISKVNDNAEALERMNDTASEWGDIFGYEAVDPGAIVDPETGEAISSNLTKMKELEEKVPEVGQAIRDTFDKVGDSFTEAEAEAEAMNIAIRQGLEVIKTGGTAAQARQAVETSLMAGGVDATKLEEIMAEVDLKVKFDVKADVLEASLDQVQNQIEQAVDDRLAKTTSEKIFNALLGDPDGISAASKQAGLNAATDLADSFVSKVNDRAAQVEMIDSMTNTFRKAREATLVGLRANSEAMDILGVNATSTSTEVYGAMLNASPEDYDALEKAKFNVEGLQAALEGVSKREQEFIFQLSKELGIHEDIYETFWNLDDVMGYLNKDHLGLVDAEKKYADRVGLAARAHRGLTDEQRLQILNQIRVERGQKRTGSLLDEFGRATVKWTGKTDEQKKKNDQVNKSLRTTQGLIAGITSDVRQELMKNAMSDFQQGIADATMDTFESNMDRAMENIAADAERRQEALAASQERATAAMDAKWEQRNKQVEKAYDSRIQGVQNAIDAEVKADEIRQRLFEAEISRLDRLAEAANRDIDFDIAINEGNLDEAAKIRNEVTAEAQDFTLEAASEKGSRRSENRQDALAKRIEAIEKERDARLEAMKKVEDKEKAALQRSQARRSAALDDELQNEQDAAQERWDTRREYLEKSLEDFINSVATSGKDLKKHVADWEAQHKGLSLTTTGQFETSSKKIQEFIVDHVGKAKDAIVNEQRWDLAGNKIANDMIKGAFGMTPQQFSEWMVTGKYPKNTSKPSGSADDRRQSQAGEPKRRPQEHGAHEGGWAGETGNNRTGVAKNVKGLHPSETMIRAQKGEFIVNRRDASANKDTLEAINSGARISSDSPRNTGKGVGGDGATGFAGLMGAMMLGAVRNSIQRAVVDKGSQKLKKMHSTSTFSAAAAGTYGDRAFTAEQLRNAATIASVGKNMGMSTRDVEIGIMTAITESGLVNVDYGDRDSLGLFQQRPSMGWGTPAQVTDPEYAAAKFFSSLKGVTDRADMSPWLAAQAVQRSFDATGSNYKQYWDEANAIYKAMGSVSVGVGAGYLPGMGGWKRASVPGKGWGNSHDYYNGIGSPLYAASDGIITESRAITSGGSPGNGRYTTPYRSYGETIAMRTASGDILRYAHLNPGGRYVSAGQKVKGGALIGRSGNTGNSTGPHTHFDVNGNYDAAGWFRAHGIGLKTGGVTASDGMANLHKDEVVVDPGRTKDLFGNLDRLTSLMQSGWKIDPIISMFSNLNKAIDSGESGNVRAGTYNVNQNLGPTVRQEIADLMTKSDVLALTDFAGDKKDFFEWLTSKGWGGHGGEGDAAVIWNKAKYQMAKSGSKTLNTENPGFRKAIANYALLNGVGGGSSFWAVGAHTSAHTGDAGGRGARATAAQREQFSSLSRLNESLGKTAPVLMMGDFNEDLRQDSINIKGLKSNWEGNMKKGGGTHGNRYIDHILASPVFKLLNTSVVGGLSSNHNAALAQYNIPGLAKGAQNIRWDNTIANLHKGESVLTEDISEKFRRGVDNFASGGNSEYNLNMHFGNVDNKEEIARYVMTTIQRAENRRPKSRVG